VALLGGGGQNAVHNLTHFQSAFVRSHTLGGRSTAASYGAYLTDIFAEACFAPLFTGKPLIIDRKSPWALPTDALTLLAPIVRDYEAVYGESDWAPTQYGLESQWCGPPDAETLVERFHASTHGLFRDFDWANVVVAGGQILGLLAGKVGNGGAADRMYDDGEPSFDPWKHSDIDLFLHGLGTLDAFLAKIRAVVAHLAKTAGKAPLIVRGVNALSLSFGPELPVVQLVLQSYVSELGVIVRRRLFPPAFTEHSRRTASTSTPSCSPLTARPSSPTRAARAFY
jgi:hypothetical protein